MFQQAPPSPAEHDGIEATVCFDFKGESFQLKTYLPLPQYAAVSMDDIYKLLAQENDVDIYTHIFDVLCSYPIEFSNANGNAQRYLSHDGHFDFAAYRRDGEQQYILHSITEIAQRFMQIENLDNHPELKQTLIAVYKVAQQGGQSGQHKHEQ